jgi:hypothetical protein
MKTLKLIVSMLSLSVILLLPSSSIFAQSNCASQAGCTFVRTDSLQTNLYAPDCTIDVQYTVYNCGGVNTYEITSYSVEGICEGMDSLLIYHYRLSALEEYISLTILQVETSGPYGPCPGGVQTSRIFTASCGIWVGCEYTVDPATRDCDQGYDAPYPDYGVNPTKVKAYKWQSCGEVCCVATYETCQDPTTSILRTTKVSAVPVNQCSLQSKYAAPCQTGCNN